MNDLISYINYLTEFVYSLNKEDIKHGVRPLTFSEMFQNTNLEADKLYEIVMLLFEKI
jgi:hypothetical protein